MTKKEIKHFTSLILKILIITIIIVLSFVYTTKAQTLKVNLTYYYPTYSNITADGSKINKHHLKQNKIKWCAVSRDIWDLFPKNSYDKKIYIQGLGYYYVKDKMHRKWYRKVDILIHHSHRDKIENKQNITIKLYYKRK